jgi:TPR repeat protein
MSNNKIKQVKKFIKAERYKRAIKLLKKLISKHVIEAEYLMGYLYFTSADVKKKDSIYWLKKAAKKDHPEALYYLSHISDDNDFGPPVKKTKWKYLFKAAKLGSVEAQRDLGCYYFWGEDGIEKNDNLSRKWYKRAAKNGHTDAQYNLGLMLLDGEGGSVNIKKGLKWLKRAANNKNIHPMSKCAAGVLAQIYDNGYFGIPKDRIKFRKWEKRKKVLERIKW